MRLIAHATLLMVLMLAGCATLRPRPAEFPALAIAPALLPSLQLSQQLRFIRGDDTHRFEALLEIDASELRLAAFAAQQEAFRLRWDGRQVDAAQADWLPAAFRPQWVLNDLLLLLAPLDALRAQLPAHWTLQQEGERRRLRWQGELVLSLQRGERQWRIEHHRAGYRLLIDSVAGDSP